MPVIPAIALSDFVAEAQTCDVVIFHGTSDVSRAIEAATMGWFSHAAMVVVGPDGSKFLWQAAGETIEVDPIKGRKHTGAQLGPLEQVMKDVVLGYGDVPTYRKLVWDRPDGFDEQVHAAIEALDGRPFPTMAELVKNYEVGTWFHIDRTDGPMFCSELVAYTYQQVGLLPDSPPANAYSPTEFSSTSTSTPTVVPLQGVFADDQPITVEA